MRWKLAFLVLTVMALTGLWPALGLAAQSSTLQALLRHLQQELGRLSQPALQKRLGHLQQEIKQVLQSPAVSIAPSAITLLRPGFRTFTTFAGLTAPGGFIVDLFPDFSNPIADCFPCGTFVVEQSLNRVVRFAEETLDFVPFATGLSTPTDVLRAPCCAGLFGNVLYVTEAGAKQISQIDSGGGVTPFASFSSAPKRMAFSPDFGAFGTAAAPWLFVSLADGRVVKVDPEGTAVPCASGFMGPEGLAFGPGGAAFKDVLFVVESAGNKISRVKSNCTVSPFPTTGLPLQAPVTLAVSPGGGWGPIDTLYVVNGATKVDRVDKNGNVTAFASGFTQANTVKLPEVRFPVNDRLAQSTAMRVSDAGAGTLETVHILGGLAASVQLVRCHPCRTGDAFAIRVTLVNESPIAVPVEIKGFFRPLDGTPLHVSPLTHKHFEATLEQGFSFEGTWLSATWPAVPPGGYCYGLHISDAETSDFYAQDEVCFTVLP